MTVLISIQQRVAAWQIPVPAVDQLRARFPDVTFVHAVDDDTRARGLATCEVAYTWKMSVAEVAAAPTLRWVHTSAVAVETLPVHALSARSIIVSNTRGVQAVPIAEHVLAVVLALSKQLPHVFAAQHERRWAQDELTGARLPRLLRGQTLGIIGVGTIGTEIARLASAFGMRVVAVRRRGSEGIPAGIDKMLGSLDDLLTAADVLVIAAPLTDATRGMIAGPQLARMKPTALLINIGRARIVDHAALAEALHAGRLAGASLDVFHHEPLPADDLLWTTPNLLLTPHTSGFRAGHWDEVIELFAENLERYRRGEPLRFQIDAAVGY